MGIDLGHLAVRRSSFIRATPERVWQEFTSFEALRPWFGTGHTLEAFEPRVGGTVRLSIERDGRRVFAGGCVVVFEPGRELSFEDNWDPPDDLPLPTFITIRLTPLYGGTHVELFHHGFERLGEEAGDLLEGYESGWDGHHLEALRSIVEA